MPKRMPQRLVERYRDQSGVYEQIPAEGRPHIVCPQCLAPILLFEDLHTDIKRDVAALHESDKIAAIRVFRNNAKCDLTTAKRMLMHLRRPGSYCHYCRAQLARGALLCPQCLSVNLDWSNG